MTPTRPSRLIGALVIVPGACFSSALLTDLLYWQSLAVSWAVSSAWLIMAGLVLGGLGMIVGTVAALASRTVRSGAPGWAGLIGVALALLLSLVNELVHSRDGYTAVIPTGLILSVLVVLMLVLSLLPSRGAARPGLVPAVGSLLLFMLGVAAVPAFSGPKETGSAPDQLGPNPLLPAPHQYLLPPMAIAPIAMWGNAALTVPAGFTARALGAGLLHPRSLYVLPNNDVLVVESNGPKAPIFRPKDFIEGMIKKTAGTGGKGGNRITLLRGVGSNGVAAVRTVFLGGLNSPFGVALIGHTLYVANTDAIMAYAYTDGATVITDSGHKLCDLPGGPIDHHWTKSLVASRDGTRLYAGVGSNSNITENGIAAEADRARVLEIDVATGRMRPYATGLRNPNGLQWEPQSGRLWAAVNERDEIGPDLVPDYITSVSDGGFYGWPYSYYGHHLDARVMPQRPDLVARALVPDYALGSHVAPLGMVFSAGSGFPAPYNSGAFVGEHGSWDRAPLSGYKVIYVPFANGTPVGPAQDFATGFLDRDGHARGRPVGLAMDHTGALLVADDLANIVWRISKVH